MKSVLTTGLLALAGISNAFPSEMYDAAANDPIIAKRVAAMLEERQDPSADAAAKIFEPFPIFNEQKQFVDVGPKSKYKWVAPGPNDQRGPCPGLNAFGMVCTVHVCLLVPNHYAQPIMVSCHIMGMPPLANSLER